jgi:hypothetical protein
VGSGDAVGDKDRDFVAVEVRDLAPVLLAVRDLLFVNVELGDFDFEYDRDRDRLAGIAGEAVLDVVKVPVVVVLPVIDGDVVKVGENDGVDVEE